MSEGGKGLQVESTRRQVIAGGVLAFAGLATSRATAQDKMAEKDSTGQERAKTYLHQEVDLKASPHRVYDVLMDSKQFAAFTGMEAEISREPGGAFSMFGGMIVGRNIELIPDNRIVQAWRPSAWEAGRYTLVKFELSEQHSGTHVVLDHTGFREGDFAHFNTGWGERYWEPLKKYLG